MYYRGAAAAIVVYDITRAVRLFFGALLSFSDYVYFQESLGTVKNWVRELQQMGPQDIVLAIAGNKLGSCMPRALTARFKEEPSGGGARGAGVRRVHWRAVRGDERAHGRECAAAL